MKVTSSSQFSVVIGEFILLTVSGTCSTAILLPLAVRITFLTVAAAATAGLFKFASNNPSQWLITVHKYLTKLVELLGLPLLASGYAMLLKHVYMETLLYTAAVSGPILWKFGKSFKYHDKIPLVIPGISFLYILIVCITAFPRMHGMFGLIAVALYLCSTLLLQKRSHIYRIKTVDIFHICVALANYLFVKSFYFLYIAVDK